MTRIALGHHGDDMMETLFLNMFHGGQLKSMPPSCEAMMVITWSYALSRTVGERHRRYAALRGYPIIPATSVDRKNTSSGSHKKYALRVGAFTPGSDREHL